MATKPGRKNIEIKRNVIETFLMKVRDYIRQNSKMVKYILFSAVILLVLSLSSYLYYDHAAGKDRERFNAVMDTYRAGSAIPETVEKCKNELRDLVNNTKFGYVHNMSLYLLASILYDEKNYREAYDLYMAFIKKSSSDTLFVPLAVNKASFCLEEQGRYDDAINLLSKYRDDKDFRIVQDQILYNLGRFFTFKGDKNGARECFTTLRSSFPESPYSARAKERMFYLSIQK